LKRRVPDVRQWLATLLWVLAAGLAAPAFAQAAPKVTAVRFAPEDGKVRVLIESDTELKYHIFLLATGSQRIVVDLPRVRWAMGAQPVESGSGKGDGRLVAGYRFAQNTATASRLVLDLAAPVLVSREYTLSPKGKGEAHRIVLDLEKATPEAFAKSATSDRAPPEAQTVKSARKPLIVIDAGHGGKDPGALSPSGVLEKDITLATAVALREEMLKSQRYDVALTRSTDVFLELEDRVTKARALGADLFISLHADAGPKPGTRGASVYTLSPEGEKRQETAKHKNDWVMAVEVDSSRPQEVNEILADLVQRETKNQSARFAQMLAPKLAEAGWPVLQNTLRKKGFYVLLSPDVPAVLLEMGFITNDQDAAMLVSESKRKKLVEGIADAIDSFFETQTQLLAAR
jgi:N-acetylmuramoyl-L-alanine amidase